MADANVSVSFSASTNDFVSQVSEAKDALQTFLHRLARSTGNWCRSELLHPRLSAPII